MGIGKHQTVAQNEKASANPPYAKAHTDHHCGVSQDAYIPPPSVTGRAFWEGHVLERGAVCS